MLDLIKRPVKRLLAAIQRRRRESELKQTQPHTSKEQIANDLRRMGVAPGDILFVHSSLKSLGYVDGGPQAVIQGLLDAVGPEGTLLLPAYYMPGGTILGTCQMEGYVFDPRTHGTSMGALPEALLNLDGVKRSIHPTHSVAAIGKHAQHLTEAHHLAPSVFGEGSPWQRLHALNGKVLGLGISMGPVTFYHLVEDTLGDRFPINVWTDQTFHLPCKGWQGEDYLVPVRPYKPELPPIRIDHKSRQDLRDFMWASLQTAGLLSVGSVGRAQSWMINAKPFFNHISMLAEDGITVYQSANDLLEKNR